MILFRKPYIDSQEHPELIAGTWIGWPSIQSLTHELEHAMFGINTKDFPESRSSNFKETGKSGGNLHGTGTKRKEGGYYRLNKDFRHIKTRFLYKFNDGWKLNKIDTLIQKEK